MTVDQRRLLHTWVGSPSSKAQSPWKEPSVGLGGCEYVRTPDRGRMLGQASHVHRHEKAPGPSRREGSFFATRTVAPMGLNSAVSHLHKGTVPRGLPGGSVGKNPPANAGDLGLIPGLGRFPGEGNGNPLQYSCLEKSHRQRSLVGDSPWGHRGSNTTEHLNGSSNIVLMDPPEGTLAWSILDSGKGGSCLLFSDMKIHFQSIFRHLCSQHVIMPAD